jgi:hypothetical protein
MWWYVLLAVLLAIAILFAWGILHLRKSQRVASEAIRKVTLADVEPLRQECERVFLDAFGESLSLEKYEEAAKVLSNRLDDAESLKRAFSRPDFYWYFVLPTGAFLGELLRVHARGEWQASEDSGVEMRIPVGSGFATTYPFDKIVKQATIGGKGDIYAYLVSALRLEEALERDREEASRPG